MSLDEIKKILLAVSMIYQNFQFHEALPALWLDALDGVSYPEAHAALRKFLRSNSLFPPVPGQILDLVLKDRADIARNVNPKTKRLEAPAFAVDLRKTLTADGLKKLKKLRREA